jgi:hypothetical protein
LTKRGHKVTTIDITPTWQEAAQIIAAVLENGTEAGKAPARAELFRMAQMLDAFRTGTIETEEAKGVWEVITTDTKGRAYGVMFATQEAADSYAEAMRNAGYQVDPFEEIGTTTQAEDGLAEARDFYGNA